MRPTTRERSVTLARTLGRGRRTSRGEGGSVAVELVGIIPILVLVTILCVQGFLAAATASTAAKAARDAARAAMRDGPGAGYAAAQQTLPRWADLRSVQWGGAAVPGCSGTCARVEVAVPLVVNGFSSGNLTLSRSAELPE
jgi:TadE-like protein